MRDDIVFDAVCMRLAAAIESLGAIEEGLRDEAFGTSWPVIWGVRNRIAHGYVALDRTIIISTVDYDLAEFEESVGRLAAIVGR